YHWREAFPVLFETLRNFCKQAQQGDVPRCDLAYETLKVTYRIKNQALLDSINDYCKTWSEKKGWKHYNSDEDALEFPKNVSQNCPEPEKDNQNNTQPEKTYAILGRSRNTCKKLLEQVGQRDKLPLNNIRNRAGFDIREEKEILWFYTLLDFITNPEDETNFFTLSMLFLPGIREKFGIIKPQDNQQGNTKEQHTQQDPLFVKILNINLEDAKSKLKYELKNIVDNIPYINVDKKFTTEISKFMLSYTTKNKIFDKQEFRNILHFLANIYFLEKKFTNPTLKFYYRRLKEIYEGTTTGITNNQIFDTPDVWGPPKPGSLEISTIHSAKGLEYDIVYVSEEEIGTLTKGDIEGNKLDRYVYVFELENESNDPENFKLYWLPVNIRKLIGPKEIRAIIRSLSDKSLIVDGIKRYIYSTVQENFNLAYVLITRAREKIH
ncbi:MAG: 3'-5' exonuclease, partial [Candidatus Aenigmatarchaeota archaeon]